jgi:hypothetical protein
MTKEEHAKLQASGMMWEIHPEFTGNYNEDMWIMRALELEKDNTVLRRFLQKEIKMSGGDERLKQLIKDLKHD